MYLKIVMIILKNIKSLETLKDKKEYINKNYNLPK